MHTFVMWHASFYQYLFAVKSKAEKSCDIDFRFIFFPLLISMNVLLEEI